MRQLATGILLAATIASGVVADTCLCDLEVLDMATSAVDDQYLTCVNRMMENVTSKEGILSAELTADGSFRESWHQAQRCNITAPELNAYHKTALAFYMTWNSTFTRIFHTDTKALGPDTSVYTRYFPYKSLHFLLTNAMQVLRSRQRGRCRTVYSQNMPQRLRVNRGSTVRLGQFLQASTKLRSRDGLTIRTCYGVELPPSNCRSAWGNFLVPPFEQFKVVAVKKQPEGSRFYLESTGTYSNLECAYYRLPRNYEL
ncbi:NAD(P)(+)--arginine ADP-ribosyltransferase 1-like [Anguilla rostrata]|uniref:NAD(P)(+)--arginine ADP-ribosyltransferase 1-like n=1 Tax=Anguilla rostrata TaxID=7938 RepID=UPI0030D3DC72